MAAVTAHNAMDRFVTELSEEVGLILTSFLRSVDTTTWLRATFRRCQTLFIRNCPVSTGRTDQYFESTTDVAYEADMMIVANEECPQRNRDSPLRCWRKGFTARVVTKRKRK